MAENDFMSKTKKAVGVRFGALRLRTYVFTAMVCLMVGIYFIITTSLKSSINLVDLVFIITVQILTNAIYYPDGKLFGTKDKTYIANKESYNEKASKINDLKKFTDLRAYCKFDYERRKEQYIQEECYSIGIDTDILKDLKTKSEKEVKQLTSIEANGQYIALTKCKKRKLFKLLFHEIPVKENNPETIMSAFEKRSKDNIRDNSVTYDKASNFGSILKFVLVGVFIAYLGVEFQEGVSWESAFKTALCLFTIVSTAVTAFTSGEKSSKVYKNTFYLQLINFIDEFFEWDEKHTIQAKTQQLQQNAPTPVVQTLQPLQETAT